MAVWPAECSYRSQFISRSDLDLGLFVGAFYRCLGSIARPKSEGVHAVFQQGKRGSVVRILFHAAFSSLEFRAVRCQTLVNFWREKKDDPTWTPFPLVAFNISSDGHDPATGERGACSRIVTIRTNVESNQRE